MPTRPRSSRTRSSTPRRETGVPAEAIRELAHAFATAPRAMICWTLGITEHHNAVDNVLALIDLVLLTGHVGRCGSGVNPLRGQNNVQGGGDMGALPDRLPGLPARRERRAAGEVRRRMGRRGPAEARLAPVGDVRCHGARRPDGGLLHRREPGPVGGRPEASDPAALQGLDFLVVQDLFLTKTAELADVVLPATAAWAESEGTVTNSERRVQRVRKAVDAPPGARDDLAIVFDLANRMGARLGRTRRRSRLERGPPALAGPRRDELCTPRGAGWASSGRATTRTTRASCSSTPGSGRTRSPAIACRSCRSTTTRRSTSLDDDFPIRLTTGRRLDSYNTGVQTAGYTSPLRRGESLDISPEDADAYGLADGEVVRVVSRRGQVEVAGPDRPVAAARV